MSQPTPNFFAIIPANVRYCKKIEQGAKLLYGELTALTSAQGYCWATNQYLADLYDVDVRTIRRWLESLKENNFIFVEIFTEGLHTTRKIWISREIKESFTEGHFCPPGGTKLSEGGDKNVLHINTTINTYEKEEEPRPSASPPEQAPEPPFSLKSAFEEDARNLAILLSEAVRKIKPDFKLPNLEGWIQEFERTLRIDKRNLEICKQILEWLPSHDFWSTNVLSADKFRKQFDRLEIEMRKNPSRNASDDLGLLKKLEAREDLVERGVCILGPNYVEFPMIRDAYFKIGEPAFREKVLNSLRKCGVPVK
jgi:hypothetical protein